MVPPSDTQSVQVVTNTPSPDLIVYRLGKLDENLTAMSGKLDTLTGTFATKEELAAVTKRLDDYKWYWRAIVAACLSAIFISLVSFIFKG